MFLASRKEIGIHILSGPLLKPVKNQVSLLDLSLTQIGHDTHLLVTKNAESKDELPSKYLGPHSGCTYIAAIIADTIYSKT